MTAGGGDTEIEPTAEERALANIATERFERFEEVFIPVENEFIDSIEAIGEGDSDQAAGLAASGTQQAFDEAGGQVASSQIDAGAAPGSGRFNESAANVDIDAATARGQAISTNRQQTLNRKLQGAEAAIAIGQGKDANAVSSLSDVARQSNREAIQDARVSAQNRATNAQALGSAAGLGTSFATGGGGGLRSMKRRSRGFSAPDDGFRGG